MRFLRAALLQLLWPTVPLEAMIASIVSEDFRHEEYEESWRDKWGSFVGRVEFWRRGRGGGGPRRGRGPLRRRGPPRRSGTKAAQHQHEASFHAGRYWFGHKRGRHRGRGREGGGAVSGGGGGGRRLVSLGRGDAGGRPRAHLQSSHRRVGVGDADSGGDRSNGGERRRRNGGDRDDDQYGDYGGDGGGRRRRRSRGSSSSNSKSQDSEDRDSDHHSSKSDSSSSSSSDSRDRSNSGSSSDSRSSSDSSSDDSSSSDHSSDSRSSSSSSDSSSSSSGGASGGRSSSASGGSSSSSSDQTALSSYDVILNQHNMYRCMHGVDPLSWDQEIASNAQQWATETAGELKHSTQSSRNGFGCESDSGLGELLAWGVTDKSAVDLWYKDVENSTAGSGQVDDYDPSAPSTGHYTQVVWRDTRRLGCGVEKTLLVCQYGCAGNKKHQYKDNIFAVQKQPSECRAS